MHPTTASSRSRSGTRTRPPASPVSAARCHSSRIARHLRPATRTRRAPPQPPCGIIVVSFCNPPFPPNARTTAPRCPPPPVHTILLRCGRAARLGSGGRQVPDRDDSVQPDGPLVDPLPPYPDGSGAAEQIPDPVRVAAVPPSEDGGLDGVGALSCDGDHCRAVEADGGACPCAMQGAGCFLGRHRIPHWERLFYGCRLVQGQDVAMARVQPKTRRLVTYHHIVTNCFNVRGGGNR